MYNTIHALFNIYVLTYHNQYIQTYTYIEYLADLISMHTLSRASRKCHTMKIVQRSTISAHSESAFSVVAPKNWNSLPYDIRCLKSLSLFKCKLSTHLLTL